MRIDKIPNWDNRGVFPKDIFKNGYNPNDKIKASHLNYMYSYLYYLFNNAVYTALLYSDVNEIRSPYPVDYSSIEVKKTHSMTSITKMPDDSYNILGSNKDVLTVSVKALSPNSSGVMVSPKITGNVIVSCEYTPLSPNVYIGSPNTEIQGEIPLQEGYKTYIEGEIIEGVPCHFTGTNLSSDTDTFLLKIPVSGKFPNYFNISNISIDRGSIGSNSSPILVNNEENRYLLDMSGRVTPRFSILRKRYPTSMGAYRTPNGDREGFTLALTPLVPPYEEKGGTPTYYRTSTPRNALLAMEWDEQGKLIPKYSYEYVEPSIDTINYRGYYMESLLGIDMLQERLKLYSTKDLVEDEIIYKDLSSISDIDQTILSKGAVGNYQKMKVGKGVGNIPVLSSSIGDLSKLVKSITSHSEDSYSVAFSLSYSSLINVVNAILYPISKQWRGFSYTDSVKVVGISGTSSSQGTLNFKDGLSCVANTKGNFLILSVVGVSDGIKLADGSIISSESSIASPIVQIVLDVSSITISNVIGYSKVELYGTERGIIDRGTIDRVSANLVTRFNTDIRDLYLNPTIAFSGNLQPSSSVTIPNVRGYDSFRVLTRSSGGLKYHYIPIPLESDSLYYRMLTLQHYNLNDTDPHVWSYYQYNLHLSVYKISNRYEAMFTYRDSSYYNAGTGNMSTNLSSLYVLEIALIRSADLPALDNANILVEKNYHKGSIW